jgi:hypothetical protein
MCHRDIGWGRGWQGEGFLKEVVLGQKSEDGGVCQRRKTKRKGRRKDGNREWERQRKRVQEKMVD